MERARARRIRIERHADRLAKDAIRFAGPSFRETGEVLGLAKTTIGHQAMDRPNRATLDMCIRLINGSATNPMALIQAQEDAFELGAIIMADTEKLIHDGLVLMAEESRRDGAEDDAALRGPVAHAEALDRYRPIARQLSLHIRELAERGVDLHALYRAQRSQA